MGRPKALLTLPPDGLTFLERLVRSLIEGGATDVLVVVRPDDRAVALEIERLAADGWAVRLVANPNADRGQLSSVVSGVNAADHPGVRGVMIAPVDAPLVTPATVRHMLTLFAERPAAVVRANYRGRHGHPVIFSRSVFDSLRRADPTIGAKAVVHAHADELMDVELDDPGVTMDVDNPEDYARILDETDTSG
jgi:molybdenum cofactor cytidylyltransferase